MTEITARQVLRQLTRGTAVILRGLAWAGEWRETLARWVLAGIAVAFTLSGAVLHPWLWPVLALGWMVAASKAAPISEDDEDDEDEPTEEDDQEQLLDADSFTELVRDLADGGNVHLIAIRRQLALELPGTEWSGPVVTALCDTAGIRVRPGVRVPGATPAVTTGIHRDDIPPLPQASSSTPVGVVGAGQHPNNNTNATTVTPIGEGGAVITTGRSIHQEAHR